MTALTDFLFPAPARRTLPGIIQWWEGRRLKYNLIVGAAGLLSFGTVRLLLWLPPDRHLDVPPLAAALLVGVAGNICYFLGPMVEVAAEKLWGRKLLPLGPVLYRMGLTFSLGLMLLPVPFAVMDWTIRVLKTLF